MRLHLHRAGQSGPALVFLHGWTMAGDIFADTFARLSDRFVCLAPDLPGHGMTQGFEPTIEASVEALDRLLDEEGLRDVTLIGWSLGAAVAWRYLEAKGAARVARMVAVDMSPAILNGADWQLGLMRQDAPSVRAKAGWFAQSWPEAAGFIAAGLFADSQGPALLPIEEARARILANDADAMARFWTSLCDSDSRAFMPRLPVPLLAIHGERSRLYPAATAQWLADTAPQGRALGISASGHSPHLEEPVAFAKAIADFAGN